MELILQGKQMDQLNQMVKEYSEEINQLKMDVQAYDNQITSNYYVYLFIIIIIIFFLNNLFDVK